MGSIILTLLKIFGAAVLIDSVDKSWSKEEPNSDNHSKRGSKKHSRGGWFRGSSSRSSSSSSDDNDGYSYRDGYKDGLYGRSKKSHNDDYTKGYKRGQDDDEYYYGNSNDDSSW